MQLSAITGSPEQHSTGCMVAGVFEERDLTPAAEALDRSSSGAIAAILERGDIKGKPGQTLMLHSPPGVAAERILLVGCGKRDELSEANYRKAVQAAAAALRGAAARDAVFTLAELPVPERGFHWKVRQAAEAVGGALYFYDQTKSQKNEDERPVLEQLRFLTDGEEASKTAEKAGREAAAIISGMALAKQLANLPGNICTPAYLAEQAKGLQDEYSSLKVGVLEEKEMEELGMGALLSVSRGSRQPAKLITIEYRGGGDAKPVVLVGKGLTFDAGGISLKPAAAMDEMKYDMCGGAGVIGTLKAVAELELPINVVGVVPSSENLPDGEANKPGDIVTSMSGQTIEILNTDAEGRLLLCDALTYSGRFDPDVVIDVATLTGACVIALGKQASGLMGNDEALVQALLAAGRNSGDRAWQLPLWDEYQEQLKSNFADMANVGGREGGTITAACFLSRYTREYRWAHLDIAGTAWVSGKEKGATGRPVPLLMQYLIDRAG